VCSFITLLCRALLLRRKRSHRYGYWRPLLEHVERAFLSRITANENFFQLFVVSARWCSSSHSPFPNKLIYRNSTFHWPPRSPDFTAPDFFLWGYCKQEVYKAKPTNLNELRQSIRETIAAIPVSTLQAVMKNFLVRCRTCINEKGGHLSSIIFKTN